MTNDAAISTNLFEYLPLDQLIRLGIRSRDRPFDPFTGFSPDIEAKLIEELLPVFLPDRERWWTEAEFAFLSRRVGCVIANAYLAHKSGRRVHYSRSHGTPGSRSIGQPAFGGVKPMVKILMPL